MLWLWMIWPFKRLWCAITSHNWEWNNRLVDPRNIFKLTAGDFPCRRCGLSWRDRSGNEHLLNHDKPLKARCGCGRLEVTINAPDDIRKPMETMASILNFGCTLVCGTCTTYVATITEKKEGGTE